MRPGPLRALFAAAVSAAAFASAAPAAAKSAARAPVPGPAVAVVWDDRGEAAAAKFSRSRAENVVSLLSRGGLEAAVFPLSRLAAAASAERRALHLVLPDAATAGDRAVLEAFVARGGGVVVHGSFSPVLAGFFGLAKPVVSYVRPSGGGAWTGYRFDAPRPLNAPASVSNRAAMVADLSPAPGRGAAVLARWRDERGKPGPAALLRSPAGFWLVRPLYDDGPAVARSELLVSLTCALHPPLWRDATTAILRDAWSDAAPGALSFAAASSAVLSAAPRARRTLVSTFLDAARARNDAAETLCRKGLYGAARTNALEAASAVVRAAAAARPLGPDRKGRPLAVWAASARPPAAAGTWEKAARALVRAGVSDVMVFAGSLAVSPALLSGVPRDPAVPEGDPFADAVAACHAVGIRVHAWFPALRFEGAPPDRFEAFEKAHRLLHSPEGRALPWLDPAVRANVSAVAAAAATLAKRTGIDGVNLDFIRYPDAATREKRSAAAVDGVVRAVRAALRDAAPGCELTASVYGWYPKCRDTVAQDWHKWLAEKSVDRAVPMNYMPTLAELADLAASQKRRRGRILCGIGASARESWLSPLRTLEQLRFAYRFGYAGAAIYVFDDRFLEEFVPVLELAR